MHTELRSIVQEEIRNPAITEVRSLAHDALMAKGARGKPIKKKLPPSARARHFMAWMKRRKTNTSRVAKATGVSYSTLASFIQGATQQLLGGTEAKIAAHYECETSEIFEGKVPATPEPDQEALPPPEPQPEPERRTTTIPIISSVAAGRLTNPYSQIEGEFQTIEISGLPPGDYFATRARGTSMDRISPDGSMLIVNRAERELLVGRRYIFSKRGETTYKRYERDPIRLEPETTDPDKNRTIFPKSDEEWSVIGRVRVTIMDDL